MAYRFFSFHLLTQSVIIYNARYHNRKVKFIPIIPHNVRALIPFYDINYIFYTHTMLRRLMFFGGLYFSIRNNQLSLIRISYRYDGAVFFFHKLHFYIFPVRAPFAGFDCIIKQIRQDNNHILVTDIQPGQVVDFKDKQQISGNAG